MTVNRRTQHITIEPRITLLDALREDLALTGTKKGCDRGECGACTVLVDGRRILSCMTLEAMNAGRRITTIEGLAQEEARPAARRGSADRPRNPCWIPPWLSQPWGRQFRTAPALLAPLLRPGHNYRQNYISAFGVRPSQGQTGAHG
jgi:hypothetical protein